MLKQAHNRSLFFVTYVSLSLLQCFAAAQNQLFGDEAFYWLEGIWLAWSYTEIPGWTPWTLALAGGALPHHELFIRLPGLLAAMSVPWLGMAIHRQLAPVESNHMWTTGLLLLALPVLGVVGVLAIPDIWIILFTLLAVLCLVWAIQSGRTVGFVLLGTVLALGLNTHLRFWLILLLAGLVITWQFRQDRVLLKKIYGLTMPVALLGLLPIVIFNASNDFPLFSFQLKDRHPWAFQVDHFTFFVVQILLTTPWVFYLCLTSLKAAARHAHTRLIQCITYLAVAHWLVYALLGFFSDTLRINVHWTLVSYVLLIVVYFHQHRRLNLWAGITGFSANMGLLLWLVYCLHWQSPPSQLNSQITNNASGWRETAAKTDHMMRSHQLKQVVVDNFMTLAQHRFYSELDFTAKTLHHPLNEKHGRAKQLALMSLVQPKTTEPGLLVVEHTALKLTQQIPFYQAACEQLHGIQLLDNLNHKQGMKSVLFFKTGGGRCELPPIYYAEQQKQTLIGWVLADLDQTPEIRLLNGHEQVVDQQQTTDIGNNPLFKTLDMQQYQLVRFVIHDTGSDAFQLQFKYPNHSIYSQRLYP